MNNFAEIILVQRYRKVTYYSLLVNNEQSLFRQFVTKHTAENDSKLNHILAWITKIGVNIGAQRDYFRNEAESADTSALPPEKIKWEPAYVEIDRDTGEEIVKPNPLRLYCMRANDHVVFLFNGDIKTADKAQNCEQVKPHFKLANKLTELIDSAIANNEITWNESASDIIVEDGFLLEWD